MAIRTYCYTADLTILAEKIAQKDARGLSRLAIECWESVDEEPLDADDREALHDLFVQALEGDDLYAELDREEGEALDDELGLLWSECLGSEPLTDNDLLSSAYAEAAEWLQTKGSVASEALTVLWLFARGRRWGQALPSSNGAVYSSGFAHRDELPRLRDALVTARKAMRGPEGEGFRPVLDEADQAIEGALEAGTDLALRLVE